MKKHIMLPVAFFALWVVACGPSQEEIAAQEKAVADSVAAYEAQVILEAEAAQAELEATAKATTDSTLVDSTKVEAGTTTK